MKTPFEILEINVEADDEAIKKAYLRKVRQHPPERDSAAFQTVRDAYEAIKTRQDRLRYALFHKPQAELNGLTAQALMAEKIIRPDTKIFTAALQESALEKLLSTLK